MDDNIVEGNETVEVELLTGSGQNQYQILSPNKATLVITDNDLPIVDISVSPPLVEEGQTGMFTFTAKPAPLADLTIKFSTDPASTAKLYEDYLDFKPTEIVIPKGQTTAIMTVATIDDKTYEGDESLVIALNPGDGYTVGNSPASLVIKDNDEKPVYQRVHIFDKDKQIQYSPPNPSHQCVHLGFVASGDKPVTQTFTVASIAKTRAAPNLKYDEVESIEFSPNPDTIFKLVDSTTTNLHNLSGLIKQNFEQDNSPIIDYGTFGTFQITFTPSANAIAMTPFVRDMLVFTTDPSAKPIILHLSAFAVPSTQQKMEVSTGGTNTIINGTESAINIGTTSAGIPLVMTFTVKNLGYSDLNLATVRFQPGTDDGFAVSPFEKSPLAAPTPKDTSIGCASSLSYDGTTFDVTLTASKSGTFKGTLIITSNDNGLANSTFTFPVTGTVDGIPPPKAEIAVFNGTNEIINNTSEVTDFGSTPVGKPVQKTFKVKNRSNIEKLVIHDINPPKGFSLANKSYQDSIPPGGSLDIILQLDATTADGSPFEGMLAISSNDADNPGAGNELENPFKFLVKGVVTSDITPPPAGAGQCLENQKGVYLNNTCRGAEKLLTGAFDATGAPVSTTAEIVGGTAKGGGDYLLPTTVIVADPVIMAGSIKAASEDVGKTVDIIVAGIYYTPVAGPNGYIWYMLNGKNNTCETCVEVWNFNSLDIAVSLAQLTAFKNGLTLPAYLPVQIYAGILPYPGNLNVYLGYRITSGTDIGKIVFNLLPMYVTIQP